MPLISYAQNREDVLLNRAFRDVENGRYVDVGAADPDIDSVTRLFYDRGWSGVNVEPHPSFHARLIAERPRDLNLGVALGREAGTVTFFAVDGFEELSTTMPDIAAEYRRAGRDVREHLVDVSTLAQISEGLGSGPVHFLKIDAEGAESDVLAGADLDSFRPWIVLVESVTFGRSSLDAPEWESLLTNAGYDFVYFDGLNRYYVAAEHADLAEHFVLPVNATDDYRLPVEGRASLFLSRIAESLGLDAASDEHEVLERLTALAADRVRFELLADDASQALAAAEAAAAAATDVASGLRNELDANWQQSFERERYIAWQAAEIQRARTGEWEANQRLTAFFRTGSWRMSLPLRVVRRPGPYVRKMLGR